MKRAYVFDADGNEVDDRVCPPGGRVVVPFHFMDSRSVHVQLHRPGYVQQALGDGFEATTGNQRAQTAAEAARTAWINRISNQWRQTWQQMPPRQSKPGLARYDADDSADEASDPSEAAYLRAKRRLSDQWRGPVDDVDDTMGIQRADAPDDIQQLPLVQQNAYVSAFNRYIEQNPDCAADEADRAGREAIAATGQDSSVFEAIRSDAQLRYADRIANAWRQR